MRTQTKHVITVDKGLPIPPRSKYPFKEMEIGDSFFAANISKRAKLEGYMSHAKKRFGMEFTARTTTEKGIKGLRIWRTA